MKEARNGVSQYNSPALQNLRVAFGGQIESMPDIGIDAKDAATMDPFSQLAVIHRIRPATAGLTISEELAHRAGAIFGTGIAGCDAIEAGYQALYVEGKSGSTCFPFPASCPVLRLVR